MRIIDPWHPLTMSMATKKSNLRQGHLIHSAMQPGAPNTFSTSPSTRQGHGLHSALWDPPGPYLLGWFCHAASPPTSIMRESHKGPSSWVRGELVSPLGDSGELACFLMHISNICFNGPCPTFGGVPFSDAPQHVDSLLRNWAGSKLPNLDVSWKMCRPSNAKHNGPKAQQYCKKARSGRNSAASV